MLPADNEVGTWVQTGGVELITDQTGLYNRIDGAAPKYIDRGWGSSVYVNYSQGSRTIQVAIHDMGSAANAQAIYNYSLPPAFLAIPGLANAVVDMGITSGYSACAYLGRFYVELSIAEKDNAGLTSIESFMSDILNLISKNRPYVSASDGGSNAAICQVPTTTPGPFLLTFELRNSGTAPVFLHRGCSGLTFDVLSCTTGYTENVAGPVFCPCLCGGTGCPACGVCAPDAGVEVSSGETTQWPWDASQLVQQPGQSCLTRVGLPAGQYRVGLQVYATAADAAVQANPLRTLTVDFPLSSTTTVVEIVDSSPGVDGGVDSGNVDSTAPSCRTDKIEFTQQTGFGNDGSVEFCLPAPDAAALAEVLAIDATIFCEWGSSGRVGCNTLTEQLCLLPVDYNATVPPTMADASWKTVCQLAALDVVAKIAPTRYE
jgi:hypothetical protein